MIIKSLVSGIVKEVVKSKIGKLQDKIEKKIQPIEQYAFEPNENNIAINKTTEDIKVLKKQVSQLKKKINQLTSKNKKDDVKWYDD